MNTRAQNLISGHMPYSLVHLIQTAQTACTLEGIQGHALYYQAGAQVGRGRPCPGTHDNAHE